jgi:photosystem II stability/assembly factor-like uncharacterized protein
MRLPLTLLAALVAASFIAASCRDTLPPGPKPGNISDTIAWYQHPLVDGKDVTGHGHDGGWPLTGQPGVTGADRFGKIALTSHAPVVVTNTQGLNFSSRDSYTISGWVQLFMTNGPVFICAKTPNTEPPVGYQLQAGPNGKVQVVINDSLDPTQDIRIQTANLLYPDSTAFQPMPADWHMVTLVVKAHQSCSLYVDSALVATRTGLTTMAPDVSNDGTPMVMGGFSFLVDDILILNKAADANWVDHRFHEGGWYAHHDTVVTLPATDTGWSMGNFGTTENMLDVCFPTPAIGYACGFNGTLLKSVDSGKTWSGLSINSTENLYAIRFKDSSNGIVGGNNAAFYFTTDGGMTWKYNAAFSSADQLRGIAYEPRGGICVVGGTGPGTSQGFVVCSPDGGATWSQIPTTGTMYGVCPLGNPGFFVDGVGGQIFIATVQAQTMSNNTVSATQLFAIDVLNDQFGYAVGSSGALFMTQNSGTSWAAVNSGVSSDIRTVKVVGQQDSWAAGTGGSILHTANQTTWSQMTVGGFTGFWNKIAQRDAHTLAFVGDNGTLYWYKY